MAEQSIGALCAAHRYSESFDPFIEGQDVLLQMSLSVVTSKLS